MKGQRCYPNKGRYSEFLWLHTWREWLLKFRVTCTSLFVLHLLPFSSPPLWTIFFLGKSNSFVCLTTYRDEHLFYIIAKLHLLLATTFTSALKIYKTKENSSPVFPEWALLSEPQPRTRSTGYFLNFTLTSQQFCTAILLVYLSTVV